MNRPEFVSVSFIQEAERIQGQALKEYTYLTDLILEPDDLVVVEVTGIYKIAVVRQAKGLTPNQQSKASKWIVAKIDVAAHKERVRKQALAQEIRNKLRERKEQYEELMIYQKLASEDTEIQALLTELQTVDPAFQITGGKI